MGPPSTQDVDRVLRASRALVAIAALSMTDLDETVTQPQWRILVMVYLRGPMGLTTIAKHLDVDRSTASRTCDKLVSNKFLNRRDQPADRRNVLLSLTGKGRAMIDRVNARRRRAVEEVMSRLSPVDQALIGTAFELFAATADEPVDPVTLWGSWR